MISIFKAFNQINNVFIVHGLFKIGESKETPGHILFMNELFRFNQEASPIPFVFDIVLNEV
jgi:hypothetical protein